MYSYPTLYLKARNTHIKHFIHAIYTVLYISIYMYVYMYTYNLSVTVFVSVRTSECIEEEEEVHIVVFEFCTMYLKNLVS